MKRDEARLGLHIIGFAIVMCCLISGAAVLAFGGDGLEGGSLLVAGWRFLRRLSRTPLRASGARSTPAVISIVADISRGWVCPMKCVWSG
jgi:hypothetical protein